MSLGLNAFQFGIGWVLVWPSRGPESLAPGAGPPPLDDNALDRYAEILRRVHDAGMGPVVTLWHVTSAAWAATTSGSAPSARPSSRRSSSRR